VTRRLLGAVLILLAGCSRGQGRRGPPTGSAVAVKTAPSASGAPQRPPPRAAPLRAAPRLITLGIEVSESYREKRFLWRKFQGVNWQAAAEALPALPPEPPLDTKGCPAGMVRIRGDYLLDSRAKDDSDELLLAQNRACAHFRSADHGVNGLCDRFDAARWQAESAKLPRTQLDFCIDRYEFPNSYGELPLVVTTYAESVAYCKKAGERLCNETEWTFACEGEQGLPYPYGYERDASACVIDILAPGPDKDTFRPRTTAHTAAGIDFAWHGKRSGESPRCRSPFGVYDMTGNVDEWTKNTRKYGPEMILKGGHWGPARQRCRPQTRGHGPAYLRYDLGFRCCADAPP
jgi:Sulfatase-modifying factor enzyme 1